MTDQKPTNPKDMVGSDKLPLHLVSGAFKAFVALGLTEGLFKYGANNYRATGVRTSIYLDAFERHYEAFKNGEWADPKTKVPHLASMGACINILVDAWALGKLTDDRPPSAPVADLIRSLNAEVPRLREMFSDHHPTHYTILNTGEQHAEETDVPRTAVQSPKRKGPRAARPARNARRRRSARSR